MSGFLLPLLAFAAAAGVLTITPGVDTAMVLRTSATSGPYGGVGASLGICLGLLVWGIGAAFGLTALLATSAVAFTVLKWAGALYLMVLGVKLLLRPGPALVPLQGARNAAGPDRGIRDAFRRGLITNVLNPKVGVFYVTFLPQFIPQGTDVAAFSLLLAGIHVCLTLMWFSLLIALTVPLGRLLSRPRIVQRLDRLTGCIFVGFGVKLALTKHA